MNDGMRRELDRLSCDKESFNISLNKYKGDFAEYMKENRGNMFVNEKITFKDRVKFFLLRLFNVFT